VRCETFGSKAAAKAWSLKVERELEELKARGVMQPAGLTLSDLIDRYIEEFYKIKPWGRSKSSDLARLKRDMGSKLVEKEHFRRDVIDTYLNKRSKEGAGPVVISAELGYLIRVLEVARSVWHLDVDLQGAQELRTAYKRQGRVGKSKSRDRRVSDEELEAVIEYIEANKDTALPMRDILEFCMASAMRISEVCRIRWEDLNTKDKTIVIRDRKHPSEKIGNHQTVPLLNATGFDAFAIVKRQEREGARIFHADPRTVGAYFTRAVQALKIKDLHLHDIRHEAISRLFAAGYQIPEVSLVSGHKDWAMLKRYTHVRAKDLHRVKDPERVPQ